MVQEVAEVNVEQLQVKMEWESLKRLRSSSDEHQWNLMQSYLSVILDHDVAVVSVSDAQDECGDAIPCARAREQIDSLVVPVGKRKEKKSLNQNLPV